MEHVIRNYYNNGVSYVELSVSVKDLANPWVYRYLVEPLRKNNPGVTVNFLAAFSRTTIKKNPQKDTETELWLELLRQIAHNTLPGEYVNGHLDQLKLLRKRIDEIILNQPNKEADGYSLRNRLVGLDYVGDEQYHSTCTFIHREFIDFMKARIADGQTRFGFRVHGGENIFIDTQQRTIVDGLRPMSVVSAGLLKLMQ